MKASKKLSKKERLQRWGVTALIVLAVLTVGVLLLKNRVTEQYGNTSDEEVLSAQATIGSISTTVSGSGNLEDEDVEDLELYSSVDIEKIYVQAGDKIEDGTLLADVDMTTVLTAMSELQDKLDDKDSEINSASSDSVQSYISASVSGRVKQIFAEKGDSVQEVMYEHGALMTLSLDGYLAADIETDALSAGDSVTVTDADGKEYSGTVESADGSKAVVLVTDNGTTVGASVTVYAEDGTEIGSGELYIHEPLSITGYAGTVSSISVTENSSVYSGTVLLYLSDTEYTATYDALLEERAEIEELLQQLITIYKEGGLYAHTSGSVSSVSELTDGKAATSSTTTTTSSTSGTSDTVSTQTLMSICPDKTMTVSISVDESNILSLSVGQEATVTVDSIEDESFSGSVTRIEKTGTAGNGVTYYTAVISLDKTDQMLSGMTASVSVRIEGVDGALIIPSDALHQTSTTSYVYTSYDETTGEYGGMTEVTVGLNNGSYVEISSGLSEGDTVYYTESNSDGDMQFFMGGGGGDMPSGGGGDMPGGGGGGMPSGGGMP